MSEDNKFIVIIMCGFFGFAIILGGLGLATSYIDIHKPPTQCRIDGAK